MSWLTDSGLWTTVFSLGVWTDILREATPLALAAVGGVIAERSGVVNIGMEGMMLTGAFFAIVADLLYQNAALGLIGGVLAGGAFALILGFGAIKFRGDQIVLGFGINLIALGLTSFLSFTKFATGTPSPCVPPIPCTSGQVLTVPDWSVPGLNNIPTLGPILFQQNPITYLMLLIVVAAYFFLFRTTLGLRIRAVGEHPRAADTAGINVQGLRYLSVVISGLLSGLAGGYLALVVAGGFSNNMTSGRGFIALAAMIFGKWTPFGAFGACLLFGFGQAVYAQAENNTGPIQDYSSLIAMLPYVLTIVALAGFIGKAIPPAADGIPYDPAEAA